MISDKVIKDGLQITVNHFVSFLKEKGYGLSYKEAAGEFYTLLRRHLPALCLPSSYNINLKNIDRIVWEPSTGEIKSLQFIKSYGGIYATDLINRLNDTLNNLDKDPSKILFENSINSILEDVQFYNNKN